MGCTAQVAKPFLWGLPWVMWALERLRPGSGAAVLIPTSLLRYLTFKLTWDLQQARVLSRAASQWPCYTACSVLCGSSIPCMDFCRDTQVCCVLGARPPWLFIEAEHNSSTLITSRGQVVV